MILVTGGTGFVGAHLLYKLVSMGVRVRAIKRKNSSFKRVQEIFSYYSTNSQTLFSSIEWVVADLEDQDSLAGALAGIKKVYHCAGLISFKPEDKELIYRVNLHGTKNLLKAVLNSEVEKFCHLSSSSATDKNYARSYVTEEMVWRPEHKCSDYARSKFLAELAVMEAMTQGLRAVIVNPTNILGPGSWDAGTSLLFQAAWRGLRIYPEGINGFVDVGDVTTAMILLMDSGISGERFIINAENLAYKDVLQWIAQALKVEPPRFRFNALEGELAWKGVKVYSRFSGKNPPLTRDNLKILNCHYYYVNKKIKQATDIKFIPIKESIEFIAKMFLQKERKL